MIAPIAWHFQPPGCFPCIFNKTRPRKAAKILATGRKFGPAVANFKTRKTPFHAAQSS
jgi:hypothetical protein